MHISFDNKFKPSKMTVADAPYYRWFHFEKFDRYGMKTKTGYDTPHIIWIWANSQVNGENCIGGYEIWEQNRFAEEEVELLPTGFTISITNS